MNEGTVHLAIDNGIARVVFDRPQARNALTSAMYGELAQACDAILADEGVRVVVFRGAGGEAFVAGTDIARFTRFTSAEDGIAYEQEIDAAIARIELLPMPTIAVVEGWAMGAGLAIAMACDFRLATPDARFGVPIARTVGNCLSMANMARLVACFGAARAKRVLLLADTILAEEAHACGFVASVSAAPELETALEAMCRRLAAHAPLTMRAAKEALRRLALSGLPPGDDLVRLCYGSADFKIGVEAFLAKRPPAWQGR